MTALHARHPRSFAPICALRCGATALAVFLLLVGPAGAQPADTAGAMQAQRAWWDAFAHADTASLRSRSAAGLAVVLSNGRTLTGDAVVTESAGNTASSGFTMSWADETAHFPTPSVAVVTSRVTETAGAATGVFRFVTVLTRASGGWRVTTAQSTRELVPTARSYGVGTAAFAEYAGAYSTPRGLAMRVAVRDSALGLIEPSGKELRMEPVGPGLFELAALSPLNGIVRLLFTRDATGRVTALSQILSGSVITFPRIP